MENLKFDGKFEISEPEKNSKKSEKFPIRTLLGEQLEMSSVYVLSFLFHNVLIEEKFFCFFLF